jgi:2-hydroxy-3-oxopropionate reductase
MTTIGFIGTGGMGSGMGANLIKAGHKLVVNDLNRQQAQKLESEGAVFKESAKAVAESCDVVLSMLPHNAAVTAVATGPGGLCEAGSGAKVWIDFSSIDKKTILEASDMLEPKGWTLLDASAGGVEEVAAAGNLALWLSGPKNLFDQYKPLLEPMASSVLHVGELGAAKLVKNGMAMLAAVQHMNIVEIMSWLDRGGVSPESFRTILENSQQKSVAVQRIMDVAVSGAYKPRKSWMPKDVSFGLDMAREMEVPMPFVSLAYQMFSIAQANGLDGYEATGIACNVYELLYGKKK